jgi:hypothetical protein
MKGQAQKENRKVSREKYMLLGYVHIYGGIEIISCQFNTVIGGAIAKSIYSIVQH